MFRTQELLAITVTAAIVTLGLATAEARDVKIRKQAAPMAPVATAPVAPAAKAEAGQVTAEKIVQVPACARKVKVIYAGYGEGNPGCPEVAR